MELQKRFLIVEDSTTQAMRLQHLLKSAGGAETVVAPGAAQALELLGRDTAWDAILSDIDMPEIDGFELCARIKQMPEARKIPFVILVSLKEMKDVARAIECGADNMLMKEYEKTYFLPQLVSILEAHPFISAQAPQKCSFTFGDAKYEVEMPPEQLAAMLISSFAMAMHQKAAKLPVAGKV
jgi:two-component system, sensor histidine kinase and response regulator